MKITFKEVDSNNKDLILNIKVDESQKYFIDSLKECLKRADKNSELNPLAIYDGELLIGFAMYGFKKKLFGDRQLWIDHFIIDKNYQGKGYGKEAFLLLLELVKSNKHNEIFLSVHRKNYSAIHVYEKYGFVFIGKYNRYLEKIMVLKY